jgi:cytoskeletal protein CcmA (bactofilin family)
MTRRDEEITGFDMDPRDAGRTPAGSRLSESIGVIRGGAGSYARGKSPEVATVPHAEAPKQSLFNETPARAPSNGGTGPSVLSLKMEVMGSITTTDELHIHGKVEGNVRASALTICEGGSVKGEVVAESVVVHGVIEGRIFAQKVQLRAGAEVRGDITHTALGIDTAAVFEGMSKRSQDPLAEAQSRAKPKA